MTPEDARRILGIAPDEDPRPNLAELKAARERIAEMVRNAPNDQIALRYQDELVEFDQALAAVREHLETLDASVTENPVEEASEGEPTPLRKRSLAWLLWVMVLLTGAGGGGALGGAMAPHRRYLVGERGPEWLVMGSQGGYLQSNGGSGSIIVNVDGQKLFEIMNRRLGRALAMGA